MDTVLLLLVSGIWEVGMNNILIIVDLICFGMKAGGRDYFYNEKKRVTVPVMNVTCY